MEYPLSYYGWRARQRTDPSSLPAVIPAPSINPGREVLTRNDLARPRILLEAGLVDEATAELERVSRGARGLQDRLQVAELFRAAGLYHKAQRLVVDAYSEQLARAPIPSLEELWWHAWPYAYAELVADATGRPGSVSAALVYSIMREESGYRADVISPVGARGLLQIMEETGQRLAAQAGREKISADDLFEPETNILLGAQYLGELAQRFNGRLAPAIASYNAGPTAVGRWIGEPSKDEDEWVEDIPYEQTRSYVKRVLRSLHVYAVLY
jgi:soluble lytic murein transglycosylase